MLCHICKGIQLYSKVAHHGEIISERVNQILQSVMRPKLVTQYEAKNLPRNSKLFYNSVIWKSGLRWAPDVIRKAQQDIFLENWSILPQSELFIRYLQNKQIMISRENKVSNHFSTWKNCLRESKILHFISKSLSHGWLSNPT